ncbi:MAG: hypothetical protein JST52_02960 [Bacteroidetes bacterium]|nr:hypothetical protein [Bacteroidota bacterium]MBS1739938.1 hypothetical protein [Bacteroidota bacterium]MBS1777585.1 hypothetical protein [Bacteroidota bacterium]
MEKLKTNFKTQNQLTPTAIPMAQGYELIITADRKKITLKHPITPTQFEITIDAQGRASVHLLSDNISLQAEKSLTFEAEKIKLKAQDQINFQAQGNLVQEVQGDVLEETQGAHKSIAQSHKMVATTFNVEIKANDDVRVDGERLFFNCND